MSSSSLSDLFRSTRSLEFLAGSGLLSSTALSSGQATVRDAVAPLSGTDADGAPQDGASSGVPEIAADLANALVLDTHAQLEDAGHRTRVLNGPLHALTRLGETVGLGHLGEGGNLLTDAGDAASSPTDANGPAILLGDAGEAVGALGGLGTSLAGVATPGHGVIGSGGAVTPFTDLLNATVLDLHLIFEEFGHRNPALDGPVHGLTALGETIGLGHLGQPGNLLTDAVNLPGAVLNGGGIGALAPVMHDLGNAAAAVGNPVDSVADAPGAGGGLLAPDGQFAPVSNLANAVVLDVHAALEGLGHEIRPLNGPLHALTGLGETIGLGHLGQPENLLTDAANLPGDLLGGQGVDAVPPVLNDLAAVAGATGSLVGEVIGAVGTPGDGGAGLLGAGAPLQPVGDVANAIIDTVHGGIEQVGHAVPILNGTVHEVVALGNTAGLGELGEGSNLVTDAANLPGDVLAGNGASGIDRVATDLGETADAARDVLGAVTGALDGASGPGAGTGTPTDAILAPVVGAATSSGPVGILTESLLDGATGANEPGTHPLIDLDVGPATASPLVDLEILAPERDPAHTIDVDAIGVGPGVPTLVSLDVLAGDGIAFPPAPDGGTDALVGKLCDLVPASAAPGGADASYDLHLDLGLAALDVGGDADTHHADPTPHTAPAPLHLLGM